jgi:hypothetical protein
MRQADQMRGVMTDVAKDLYDTCCDTGGEVWVLRDVQDFLSMQQMIMDEYVKRGLPWPLRNPDEWELKKP